MLTTAELTAMRSTQALTLVDACTIQRRTQASDSAGGFTETWATASTTTCRIAPMSAADTLLAGKEGIVASWTITLPYNTDIRADDRIVIGTRSFEVNGIRAPETRETARVVLCQER